MIRSVYGMRLRGPPCSASEAYTMRSMRTIQELLSPVNAAHKTGQLPGRRNSPAPRHLDNSLCLLSGGTSHDVDKQSTSKSHVWMAPALQELSWRMAGSL